MKFHTTNVHEITEQIEKAINSLGGLTKGEYVYLVALFASNVFLQLEEKTEMKGGREGYFKAVIELSEIILESE